jgi:hypothetical protein
MDAAATGRSHGASGAPIGQGKPAVVLINRQGRIILGSDHLNREWFGKTKFKLKKEKKI